MCRDRPFRRRETTRFHIPGKPNPNRLTAGIISSVCAREAPTPKYICQTCSFVVPSYSWHIWGPRRPYGSGGSTNIKNTKTFVGCFGLNRVLPTWGSILRHLGVTSLIIIKGRGDYRVANYAARISKPLLRYLALISLYRTYKRIEAHARSHTTLT